MLRLLRPFGFFGFKRLPADRRPPGRRRRRGAVALLVATGLAVSACATAPDTIDESTALAFLQVGETRREAVILRLGIPSASFENDRILTYRLGAAKEGGVKSNWYGPYHLILVFDEGGRLAEHRLLRP
jgi:hypothetical protein